MQRKQYFNNKVPISFYRQEDVVLVAKSLLGKYLCVFVNEKLTKGKIVETEAYSYLEKGCHAYNHKKTKRNASMFESGGVAYLYVCYGIHTLFNIVTNKEGLAEAVLIRAIAPIEGMENALEKRNASEPKVRKSGPGKLTKALGISLHHDRTDLTSNTIWIEEGVLIEEKDIVSTTRVGIDYAEEDALLPWRFYIKDNDYLSKK